MMKRGMLTVREYQVLILLGEGLVKREIAKELGIGYTTVDSHVQRIYKKFGVANAPKAITVGYQTGVLCLKR